MSNYNIGDTEYEWQLVARNRHNGRVETWHNRHSGNYGVYLYANVQSGDEWLMFKICKTREQADEISDLVAGLLR